jgi:hypothetical protein
MARRKVRLRAGHGTARQIVLVVELATMGTAGVFLVLLVAVAMVLVVLAVLEGLAQVHLHGIALVASAPVHHDIVGLVPVALVEHAELLGGRLSRGRWRWGRSVGVVEGDAGASGGCAHAVG